MSNFVRLFFPVKAWTALSMIVTRQRESGGVVRCNLVSFGGNSQTPDTVKNLH